MAVSFFLGRRAGSLPVSSDAAFDLECPSCQARDVAFFSSRSTVLGLCFSCAFAWTVTQFKRRRVRKKAA